MKIKYKKGAGPIAIVWAVILAVGAFIFLFGGGAKATWNLAKVISSLTTLLQSVPKIVWFIFGLLFVLKLLGGKK